jgi:hypothetical protein
MRKIMIIFAVICMTACYGPKTPVIGGVDPFIVTEIEMYSESLSIYRGKCGSTCDISPFINQEDPAIILPTGDYNVGDTIKPLK